MLFNKKFTIMALLIISFMLLISINQFSSSETNDFKHYLNLSDSPDSLSRKEITMSDKLVLNEDEWKKKLTPEQYRVLRQKGTERAFSGEYWNHFEEGTYCCAGCGAELFSSESKFDSHCGWPSYFIPLAEDRVYYVEDRSFGMIRTEVLCSRCDGHLGHVFDDGPKPTGLRYCINSVSIKFVPKK